MNEELRNLANNDQALARVRELGVVIWNYREGLVSAGAAEDMANIFALQMQQLLLDRMMRG